MKLKKILTQFLLSEGRSESIAAEEAYEVIDGLDSKIKEDLPKVYRGKYDSPSILKIDPSQFTRTSREADNYYTLWIDNNWSEKYPKRSKSIICSKSKSVSETYGDSYVVVPYDDYTFGVCPSYDIWHSFSKLEKYRANPDTFFAINLSYFVEQKTDGEIEKISDESYSKMVDHLKILNSLSKEEWEEYAERENRKAYLAAYRATAKDAMYYDNILEFVEGLLNPQENGFQTLNYTEISESGNQEVWTSGECLMIEVEWFQKVFQDII